jgi:hypothetical protein
MHVGSFKFPSYNLKSPVSQILYLTFVLVECIGYNHRCENLKLTFVILYQCYFLFVLYCLFLFTLLRVLSFVELPCIICVCLFRPRTSWTIRFPVPSSFRCRICYWFYSSPLVISISRPIFGKPRKFGDYSLNRPGLCSTRTAYFQLNVQNVPLQ